MAATVEDKNVVHIYESTLQYTTHHGVFIVMRCSAKREAKHTILGVDSWSTNNIPACLHTINALAYIRSHNDAFLPVWNPKFELRAIVPDTSLFFDHGCSTIGFVIFHGGRATSCRLLDAAPVGGGRWREKAKARACVCVFVSRQELP